MLTLHFARLLRRTMTDAERRLWKLLRAKQLGGYKFRRQAPIGKYIVDFVCFKEKLIIELDGGQHADQQQQDEARTRWLQSQGYRVIRFWNTEALASPEGVYQLVQEALTSHIVPLDPPPQSSPTRGEEQTSNSTLSNSEGRL